MKKFLALLLALTLALSLGAVAFADGETEAPATQTYTITAPSDTGHTYEIYQIFTGDYYDGKLSNLVWGESGTGETGKAVDSDTLSTLTSLTEKTDTEKLTVIEALVDFNNPIKTIDSGSTAEVVGGYYLIKDASSTVTENDVFSLNVVEVVDDVNFTVKGDVPEVIKEIGEAGSEVDTNEASIGDTVKYSITGTMPSNLADYNTYFYKFTDTLTKGLTYNNDLTVTVDGTEATKYFYINATEYSADNGTAITVSIGDILALNNVKGENNAKVFNVTKDTEVIISYTATLNENAVIAGDGNDNKVKLDYSNNPNASGTPGINPPPENPPEPTTTNPKGTTPESVVTTYTTELTITKTDGTNILPGAEFTLTGTNVLNIVKVTGEVYKLSTDATKAVYWKLTNGTYTTDDPETAGMDKTKYASLTDKYEKVTEEWFETQKSENPDTAKAFVDTTSGKVTFTGLGAGEYTLTESVTPAGYNTIAPITFTVSFSDGAFSTPEGCEIQVNTTNKLEGEIVNQSGATLPETGGIGTTIFYVVGAVLVAGAAIVLFAKKRAEE